MRKRTSLEAAGNCTQCGTHAEYRNSAGMCNDCHNAAYFERQTARKHQIAEARERGRQYWATQNVKPGDKVTRCAASWCGLGEAVTGVAKVGACGAYVSAPHFQAGQLTRLGWHKI